MGNGWMIIALCVFGFCFSEAQRPTVKISNTMVQGLVQKTRKGRDVESFIGIPYAEPPIGDLRFRDPIPKVYPDGTLLADKPPIRCLQSIAKIVGMGNSPRDLKGDEDCLYLNVHRPAVAGSPSLPVMVYFQAADLIPGTADVSYIGPEYLLDRDIILVTLTYRLGVFGFLSTGDEAAPGNFGLKDQKVALEWVKSNIASFGGDPDRVTLFGQGEAAKLVHIQALVNHTEGLFHRYILESGTAFAPWAVRDSKNSAESTQQLATVNGCSTNSSSAIVECLRLIDSRELLNSSYQAFDPMDISFYKTWTPTKEPNSPSAFLTGCPDDLITRDERRDLPFIAGITLYENTWRTPVDMREPDDFMRKSYLSAMGILNMSLGSSDLIERVLKFYEENNKAGPDEWEFQDEFFGFFDRFGYFLQDFSYYYPQVKMLEERRQNSRRPFYFYKLEYRGEFSMYDWRSERHGKGESTHGDDLLYLFYHDTSKFPYAGRHTVNEKDYQVVDTMVELWTSFAAEGVPRSRGVDWKPYNSQGQYLKIGRVEGRSTYMESGFLSKRMRFWANITLQNCELYI